MPKSIEFTKAQMVRSAQRSLEYFNVQPAQKALLCLSVNYIAGMMMVVRAFTGKLNLILSPPDAVNISETIHFAAMVPLQVEKLITSGDVLCNYKKIIIGGTPVSAKLAESIVKEFPGKVWETYAMTETLTHVAVRELTHDTPNIYFSALPGITFTKDIRDCLVIHDPLIQSEPIVTNDCVDLISDASFHLLGRIDNVINSGGIKIQPEAIEEILANYIEGMFCISSLRDSLFGEIVVLVLDAETKTHELQKGMDALDKYQRPKKTVELTKLPVNANGKIDRKKVKSLIETLQF
jgi:O-succinylbenzoic acid--CoA ligase